MKNYRFIVFAAIYLFCIPTSFFPMEEERRSLAVAVFDTNTTAIATNQNCVLTTNCQAPDKDHTVKILHEHPTHNIIADKRNRRLGVFSQFGFVVYDIKTGNRIWSKMVDSDNCSAAFSPIDKTIFLCDNGYLSTNENMSMNLPYTGNNRYFGIECHSKKKEILYPCSNTLATYSFKNKRYKQYYPHIEQTDTIVRALYSPEGSYIALLTDKQDIFIYNQKNKSTVQALGTFGHCYGCTNPIFIPYSNILFFLMRNGRCANYFDIKKMHSIITRPETGSFFPFKNDNALINRIDFSPNGFYMVKATGTPTAQGYKNTVSTELITRHLIYEKLFLHYHLLKMYSKENEGFLPSDILKLLIQKLYILFTYKIFR